MVQEINLQQALGGDRSLVIPPGTYDLVGQSFLDNCYIQAHGATFQVADKTQSPILMGSDVTIDGARFFWPNQDGSTSYPALITDPGAQSNNIVLRDVDVVNAWIGFEQSSIANQSWGAWHISGGAMYACLDLFRLAATGGWHLTGVDFSPGLWGTVLLRLTGDDKAMREAATVAARRNAILHVIPKNPADPATNDVVTWSMTGCATFAWGYGIVVGRGGIFANSDIDVIWDGTATVLSAAGLASGNVWRGSAICYVPDFVGAEFQTENPIAFVLGDKGELTLDGFPVWSRGGVVLSGGAAVYARSCNLTGWKDGGASGAIIQGTADNEMIIQNCRFDAGAPAVAIGGNAVETGNVFRPNVRPSW